MFKKILFTKSLSSTAALSILNLIKNFNNLKEITSAILNLK